MLAGGYYLSEKKGGGGTPPLHLYIIQTCRGELCSPAGGRLPPLRSHCVTPSCRGRTYAFGERVPPFGLTASPPSPVPKTGGETPPLQSLHFTLTCRGGVPPPPDKNHKPRRGRTYAFGARVPPFGLTASPPHPHRPENKKGELCSSFL